jgi:hypothetical protein
LVPMPIRGRIFRPSLFAWSIRKADSAMSWRACKVLLWRSPDHIWD